MASLEFFETVTASGSGSTPQLLVQRIPERSSWVSLPPALASQLYQSTASLPLVLELRALVQRAGISLPSDAPKYVAWGGACGAPGSIGIPAGVLSGLGLVEGRPVLVRPLWEVPHAVSVTVEPASEDDWEVVELNAEYLEGRLLTQVGVVSPHQPFPFWVHTHLISLRVTAMEPAGIPAARLVPGTEIHVAPRVRVRPGSKAGNGTLFGDAQGRRQQQQQQQEEEEKGKVAGDAGEEDQPVETGLRVQRVSSQLAARWAAAERAQQGLPPMVLPVGVAPATLSRCRLQEGDWVRLSPPPTGSSAASATARSAGRFACLAACEQVAVGHVGLTEEQCSTFGVEPFCHVRVQRLGRSQRELVREAAELQQRAAGRGPDAELSAKAGAAAAAAAAAGDASGVEGSAESGQQGALQQALRAFEGQQGSSMAAGAMEGMSWLGGALEKAVQALLPVLAAGPRALLQAWGVPRPGGLLVSGPSGSGKSALMAAAGQALEQHPQCLTHTVVVKCREITWEGGSHAQALISAKVLEALEHLPSLLVFDDLDVLCRADSDGPDGGSAPSDPGLITWLCDVLDYLCTPAPEWGALPPWLQHPWDNGSGQSEAGGSSSSKRALDGSGSSGREPQQEGQAAGSSNGSLPTNGSLAGPAAAAPAAQPSQQAVTPSPTLPSTLSLGLLWPPVAFAATCKDVAALAAPLRAAGRLDQPLSLPAPSAESRAAILAGGVRARGAHAAPADLQAVAERADGFDAADLEVLLDRAMHFALRRRLASASAQQPGSQLHRPTAAAAATAANGTAAAAAAEAEAGSGAGPALGPLGGQEGGRQVVAARGRLGAELSCEDLMGALEGMTPAAFWGVHTQKSVQQGVSGWEDVGGMEDVRAALYEALELPTKYAKLVAQAPLRLRTGVLLYGPPGCGKTHVVSAAVAAANVRCITVSGPELLNKYIGASEAAVRDVFQRAAAAAPSVLFFDEFDAIAPQRGHDNTGVTDRVVNQLLTELDGVEGLRGVCVIAATSRPDLIDAALLRPGRLDRLLYCGFPSPLERGKILSALARSLRLAPDIDLPQLAYEAEFFTGADLSALLSEAQLAAVHETLDAEDAQPAAAAHTSAAAASQQQPLHKHHHPGGVPAISRRHLEAALAGARPSVPEDERDRLEGIYLKFQQSREPGGSDAAAAVDKGKGKKVSWA